MTEGGSNGNAFEARMKLWSWRFIVLVAFTLLGLVWNNLNSKIESYDEVKKDVNRLEREFVQKQAAQLERDKAIDYRLGRIDQRLDSLDRIERKLGIDSK